MGQLCSRPKTVENETRAVKEAVALPAEEHQLQHSGTNGHVRDAHARHVSAEPQRSDAASSELDMVVQHLRDTNYSVTGSAPELLQQWDHDHRVVLDSIDAAIQVLVSTAVACSIAIDGHAMYQYEA